MRKPDLFIITNTGDCGCGGRAPRVRVGCIFLRCPLLDTVETTGKFLLKKQFLHDRM